jgi:uncharacterized protein YkwD
MRSKTFVPGFFVYVVVVALWSACASRQTSTHFAAAEHYTQASGWTAPIADRTRYEAVSRASTDGAVLTPDPALASVATELAARVARDPNARVPSVRVIQALSWFAGVTDPLPVVLTVKGAAASVEAEVERGAREMLQNERVTHVGVGRARASDGAEVAVVAATRRRLTLAPVPRRVAVGTRIELRGRLAGGLRAPAMVLTLPDGHTEESPLGDATEFLGQFRASARGTWQVEITADSEAGSTVVANFPVYVDTDAPATPEETNTIEAEDPATVEATLLRLINEARQRAHLEPVASMPAIETVARAHARDMAENRYVAHNTRDGTTPGQRLRAAGLLSGLSLENVARGYGAREIHEGLMVSPGHRANVLNPRVTHVGIGVVREAGPSGALLVTQDFIEVVRAIDTTATVRDLLERINATRIARNLARFEVRPQLQAAAERAARAFFASSTITEQQALAEATEMLRNEALLFRRVQVAAAFGPRAEESATMQPLFDRETTAVGIGIAQGDRPGAPPQSVFVVYVLAVPR